MQCTSPHVVRKYDSLLYRPDIDGLRAVAVTLVLVFHFSLVPTIKAGFIGVDIFFVISGFLITTIIRNQLISNRFTLGGFYVNRIRRLVPALFFVLFLTMLAGTLILFPADLIELSRQALATQLYVANIYFWKTVNYFGLQIHEVFLLHMWSLAVEEQFYLIYPAFLMLLHRYSGRYFWVLISVSLIVSFALNIFFVGSKPEATFYLLPMRGWELLIGALVVFLTERRERGKATDQAIGLLGAFLVAAGTIFYRKDLTFPGFYALLPTVGAGCLILSGQNHKTLVSSVLSLFPIVYIGRISYSLYLVHWPINIFAERLIEDYSQQWRIIMFLLSFALASLSYHLVENPLRYRWLLRTTRELLSGYAIVLVTTTFAFAIISTTNGLPHRFPDGVVRLANYVNDRTPPLPHCEYRGQSLGTAAEFCQIGVTGQPSWLIYGDSHAWAAHAVFDEWLKRKGQTGLFFFASACLPLEEIHIFGDRDNCFSFNQAITLLIQKHTSLKDVVLVSSWLEANEGRVSASADALSTKAESLKIFSEQFSRTVTNLRDLGRHVYIWEPVPGARENVPQALARAAWEKRKPDIEFDTAEYLNRTKFFFDVIEHNRDFISASFSSSGLLCQTGKCAVTNNNIPLYYDDNHMSKSTAPFWVQVLEKPRNY
jgi:peptidoglycan/LPS O-acetylase OafA/YrhL